MATLRNTLCFLLALGVVLGVSTSVNASDEKLKPVYEIKEHGKAPVILDLSKPEDKKKFDELVSSGSELHVEQVKNPNLARIFSLSWDTGLWSLVVFGGLLFILSKFAWPNMLEGLKKRESNIRSALDEAEKAKSEAQRLQVELASERVKAAEQVRGMLEEARKDAAAFKDQVKSETQKEIAAERDRLRREIDMARDQALTDLWTRSTELATKISAKTIKREIRAEDHRKLFDEALAELKSAADNKAKLGA